MELNLQPLLLIKDFEGTSDPLFKVYQSCSEALVTNNFELTSIGVPSLKIQECRHCESCFSKEVPCSYLDDFNLIASEMVKNQKMVFFTHDKVSMNLLMALTRTHMFSVHPEHNKIKQVVVVTPNINLDERNAFSLLQANLGIKPVFLYYELEDDLPLRLNEILKSV
jgi:hypothetical protein